MRPYPALFAAAALALAFPAAAQETPAAPAACAAPAPVTAPNGAAATMEQMQSGKKAIDAFLAASDQYQECEIQGVAAQRAAAKAAKAKFDEKISKQAQTRINANQKDKEAAGSSWGAAVKAFKAAHPA